MNGPASEFYFAVGNAYDDVLTKAWKNAGILIATERNIPDIGINMGGRIDAIVKLNGRVIIIEHKSIGNTLPRFPKPEHEAQAMIYSAVTGLPAHVLYMSRNPADWKGNLNIVSFELETSEERLRYHVRQAVIGYIFTKNKRLPAIPLEIDGEKKCGFCPFIQNCWHGEPMPVQDLETNRVEKAEAVVMKRVDEIMAGRDDRRYNFLKELGVKDDEPKAGDGA